jgi:hypothetical protein
MVVVRNLFKYCAETNIISLRRILQLSKAKLNQASREIHAVYFPISG